MIGDMKPERLEHVRRVGFEPIDLTKSNNLADLVEQVTGAREVDAAVDAVGFEAHGQGSQAMTEAPATVLNSLMAIGGPAARIGIPGLYVTEDPGAKDDAAREGNLRLRFGLGWSKSHSFFTGQTPVLRYNRQLMMAILHDRIQIAKVVNATVIPLSEAPEGYHAFDEGAARKYVLDPNGVLKSRRVARA
jgi:glutathione-independent formaldehyde dehydrogenase